MLFTNTIEGLITIITTIIITTMIMIFFYLYFGRSLSK